MINSPPVLVDSKDFHIRQTTSNSLTRGSCPRQGRAPLEPCSASERRGANLHNFCDIHPKDTDLTALCVPYSLDGKRKYTGPRESDFKKVTWFASHRLPRGSCPPGRGGRDPPSCRCALPSRALPVGPTIHTSLHPQLYLFMYLSLYIYVHK